MLFTGSNSKFFRFTAANDLFKRLFEIPVQVNGKVRGKIETDSNTTKEEMEQKALEIENVKKHLEGLEIIKVVTIPGKLVSIVAK